MVVFFVVVVLFCFVFVVICSPSQYFTAVKRKFLTGKSKALFTPLCGGGCPFSYGRGVRLLQWRGLNYVLSAWVYIQGFSLSPVHTLVLPHRQPIQQDPYRVAAP